MRPPSIGRAPKMPPGWRSGPPWNVNRCVSRNEKVGGGPLAPRVGLPWKWPRPIARSGDSRHVASWSVHYLMVHPERSWIVPGRRTEPDKIRVRCTN